MIGCYDINIASHYVKGARKNLLDKLGEMNLDPAIKISVDYPPVKIPGKNMRAIKKLFHELEQKSPYSFVFVGRLKKDER